MLTLSIVVAGALVWVSALAQHLGNILAHGARWVRSDRSQAVPEDGFSGRAARALRNNVESAAMYVPVAVVPLLLHHSSPALAATAGTYAVARAAFTLGYWLRINPLRSGAWALGMVCIAAMAAMALRAGLLMQTSG